jgi:hypothetical protein
LRADKPTIHRHSDQKPRTAALLARVGWLSMLDLVNRKD